MRVVLPKTIRGGVAACLVLLPLLLAGSGGAQLPALDEREKNLPAGDLGYAYGTYESRGKASDEKPSERGSYLRIWKRHSNDWRVVLDITNPAPPAKAQ